ncbi:MAG TPA: GNAT family N-acetyltransferase [Acidimicrobiia bacterium]|nr:GNAT family N-acetyltransferase [Acidimicrobiia bacterium]HZQ76501.1 GNAT family N-acetyltransferase [Acidimicrobiia bacterium]
MSFWPVQPLDPATCSDDDLAGLHALEAALETEALPGEPVAPLEHTVAELRHGNPFLVRKGWVVRHGDAGSPIAARASCSFIDVPENRHHAHVTVDVHAAVRGLGIGSALLARAVDAARRWHCTVLDFEARVGGPGEPFLRRLGAERRLVERRSRCRTADIDRARLEGWVRRAGERAAGYSLLRWTGRCPDDVLADFLMLKGVMNTAPLEALDWDDERITPDQWRLKEAAREGRGIEAWTVCARHDESRDLAGYTEIHLPGTWPEMAWQGDTGVWPKHRDRGLGRWLKAVMALRLLDERPGVRHIETWNAGSNEAMLSINVAMGFRPLENWGDWQIPTAAAAAALRRRGRRLEAS